MPTRTSEATWTGSLREGEGEFVVGEDFASGEYTFVSRFEDEEGESQKTNPEELIGAAHASCFSMALSADLGRADYEAERVHTTAAVHLEDGAISRIDLVTEASVPGIDDEEFQEIAQGAKEGCPVSRALAAVPEITLDARLV
jgi:osmotically inducible protein OsmC